MKILLVEDNEETRFFLEDALKEEGFSVDIASDGTEGMKKALAGTYDALVLDNVMPGKTGLEICAETRKRGKKFRIMLLSVNGDADTKIRGMEAGADDYMEKPFSFAEFLARLRALLRRPEPLREEIMETEGLSLNARNRTVFFRKKEISCSPKEFELLRYLLENRGKTVSRMEILEHVWDMNADPFTNTVEMHVSNLRKKLKSRGAGNIISTVARAGYKIS